MASPRLLAAAASDRTPEDVRVTRFLKLTAAAKAAGAQHAMVRISDLLALVRTAIVQPALLATCVEAHGFLLEVKKGGDRGVDDVLGPLGEAIEMARVVA